MGVFIEIAPAVFDAGGDANYGPPNKSGLHVCGAAIEPSDETNYEQAFTAWVAHLPTDEALRLFSLAKGVGICSREEQDFVFDLVIDGDITDDFYTNHQLISAINTAINGATP